MTRYGMNLVEREEMLASQDYKCKACKTSIKFSGYSTSNKMDTIHAVVDHCHKTKKVRGVLCGACNLTLGKSQDSIVRLEALANYLKENNYVQV